MYTQLKYVRATAHYPPCMIEYWRSNTVSLYWFCRLKFMATNVEETSTRSSNANANSVSPPSLISTVELQVNKANDLVTNAGVVTTKTTTTTYAVIFTNLAYLPPYLALSFLSLLTKL